MIFAMNATPDFMLPASPVRAGAGGSPSGNGVPLEPLVSPVVAVGPAPVLVTPTSGPIPPPSTVAAPPAPATSSIMSFLQATAIAGIPNWVALGAVLLLIGAKKK